MPPTASCAHKHAHGSAAIPPAEHGATRVPATPPAAGGGVCRGSVSGRLLDNPWLWGVCCAAEEGVPGQSLPARQAEAQAPSLPKQDLPPCPGAPAGQPEGMYGQPWRSPRGRSPGGVNWLQRVTPLGPGCSSCGPALFGGVFSETPADGNFSHALQREKLSCGILPVVSPWSGQVW